MMSVAPCRIQIHALEDDSSSLKELLYLIFVFPLLEFKRSQKLVGFELLTFEGGRGRSTSFPSPYLSMNSFE